MSNVKGFGLGVTGDTTHTPMGPWWGPDEFCFGFGV